MAADEKEAETLTRAIDERLASDPRFERLSEPDPAEVRSFCNADLACLVEMRTGQIVDPSGLEGEVREAWIRRTLEIGETVDVPFFMNRRCYWVRDATGRIGTIAYRALPFRATRSIEVASVYVVPERRRRGLARRLLTTLRDAAYAAGTELVTLNTSWCAQPAVRFYGSIGMWIRSWKHDLEFMYSRSLPEWQIDVDGDSARFLVGDDARELIIAERRGDRLGWIVRRDSSPTLERYAPGTFALALAAKGWPLIRNDAEWRLQLEAGYSDAGSPEGLAFKIREFEAWAKQSGWPVDTPRIPGLQYLH
jgi:GNAT superfamily N-acetyltransferase